MSRLATCCLLLAVAVSPALAQTESVTSTENALWEVHLNVRELFASPLGAVINDVIHQKAPDGKLNVDAFVEAIGFDPRTAITQVVVYGDDFEKPNVTAIANIGKSRGNIEGWLLAAPGYQSETFGETAILHSFNVEEHGPDARLWCAIPKVGDNYVVVAGLSAERVRSLIEEVSSSEEVAGGLPENAFLSLNVNDLSAAPFEVDENDPGSAIIKTLQSISLTAASEGDDLVVTSEVATDNAARAEQLNQLLVGMKAMVQLAIPEKDPHAAQAAKLLENLTVSYSQGSKSLSTRFSMGYEELTAIINDMHHKR